VFEVKNRPPLKVLLTYQLAKDKQEVYCRMQFDTPYKVVTHYPMKIDRYGDRVICCFVIQDGKFITLRIDHPDCAIHGCTTRYNRQESAIPYFFDPTFNMDIKVKEGCVDPPTIIREYVI
jgi:hypothetical protein